MTNLDPLQVGMLQLRSGQHSFALFGHPYNWETAPGTAPGTIYCWGIDPKQVPYQSLGSTFYWTGVPSWAGEPTNVQRFTRYHADIVNGMKVVGGRITVGFAPGVPGKDDVKPGNTFPAANTGTWFNPATNAPWEDPVTHEPLSVDEDDPATGLPRKANSDWMPPQNDSRYDILRQIVAGGAKIRYRNGYPDFSPWTEYTATLDLMVGDKSHRNQNNRNDFQESNLKFGTARGLDLDEVVAWIDQEDIRDQFGTVVPTTRPPKWVWHHYQDMRHMQLVPSHLNTAGRFYGALHSGGAALADIARW